ncbi:MAG: hypothetical protein US53_C0036G0009 [Candidatus Woesebacteria bacterium GW2011_GWA1_37_7]|uniref:Uncharacterized protein n=1 Tax=Candidatus Woesebacteria bacterium GW2011_GWA1_37_7 TaxID=1618545 RepID=A0A0G0H3T5_9BACT|nr:MAG: hypothetical protein US53_C0036G0009 [Candidatus Woesebacteria bacterium GW2011_GWA1_37_7]
MVGTIGDTIATQLLIFAILIGFILLGIMLYQKMSIANKHLYMVRNKDRQWKRYLGDPPDTAGLALVGTGANAKGLRVNDKTSDSFNAGILFSEWIPGSLHIDPKSLQEDLDRLRVEAHRNGDKQVVFTPVLDPIDMDALSESERDQITQDTLNTLEKHTVQEYMVKNMEENLKKKKEGILTITNILIFLSLAMNGFMIYTLDKMGKSVETMAPILQSISERLK